MGKTAHVEHLAALGEEGADISAGVHWLGEDVRVFLWRLALANETSQDAGKGNGLLHGAAGRRWGQCLKVKGQVVLNWGRRLHRLHFKCSTDVCQGARTEGEALGVVSLPALVLGAQVEGSRVLQVWREYDRLVARLARQLDAEVPGVECDECEGEVFGDQMLLCEGAKAIDGVTERARIADLVPRQGRQASCKSISICGSSE